jgi:phosphatidate cytidylyltransferase
MMLSSGGKITYADLSTVFFASFFISFFISSLLVLVRAENGRLWVFFPFIIAFTTDSSAFFVGRLAGKHKLAPHISPNKTVEGSVGGLCGAVIFMLIYALLIEIAFGLYVKLLPVVLCAILGSVAGQFGDLVFSGIKRQAGLKDYGDLLPGHGGILDRFDSVIFVAPLVTAFLFLYSPFL